MLTETDRAQVRFSKSIQRQSDAGRAAFQRWLDKDRTKTEAAERGYAPARR